MASIVVSRSSGRSAVPLVQTPQKFTKEARTLFYEHLAAAGLRTQERRALARRRFELGEAVMSAGLAEWSVSEILGVLLDARERIGGSPSKRRAAWKRGEQHRSVATAAPNVPRSGGKAK